MKPQVCNTAGIEQVEQIISELPLVGRFCSLRERWKLYEHYKRQIAVLNLSADEYERAIFKLAEALHI